MRCYIVVLDGSILGVFSTLEKALAWIEAEPCMTHGEKYECRCGIETWDIE